MKKIVLILAACAALVACKKDDNGQLDPNAMIALNYAATAPTAASTSYAYNPDGSAKYLSAREIVEKASIISWYNSKLSSTVIERGFDDATQRDFVNNRLLMWGSDVITSDGKLQDGFIEGYDYLLVVFNNDNRPIDTIAYIPNSVIRKAEQEIKAAYSENDLKKCYELFDKAFTYTPITGNEWKALKAEGKN